MKYDRATVEKMADDFVEWDNPNHQIARELANIVLLMEIRDLLRDMKEDRIDEAVNAYIEENK